MKLTIGLVGLGVVAVVAPAIGRVAFDRQVQGEINRLAGSVAYRSSPFVRLAAYPDLPEPVRRYFEFAGVEGRSRIRFVRLLHGGLFRTTPDSQWMPIEGEEYVSVDPPGFVWYANARPMPLVHIRARDLYMNGSGNMLVKPLSLFTLADARGPEVDVSALLRFIAEAPWFPTALVPGNALGWEAIDGGSARVIVRSGSVTATGVFRFGADGRIVGFETHERFLADGQKAVRRPWGGVYSGYEEVDGFRIPSAAEVRWLSPPEVFPYARFELYRVEYNVFRRF
ncbi:MAG TPA: DUF6544 family protein [Vicinamibacterales bacterium]|jgi:hypothetical protein|nr:DUF6544 family protein [Vicinamibacterales bacterium]